MAPTSPAYEPAPQPLNAKIIRQAQPSPPPIQLLDSTDSTNTQVMQMLLNPPQPSTDSLACAAEYQQAGRGRSGRKWLSPPGRNVMLSVGKRLPTAALRRSGLSLAVGVEACGALAEQGATEVRLKWPNDLMLDEAKLGGILVESSSSADEDSVCVVIGIGINLYLPPDIRQQIEQEPRAQRTAHLSHLPELNRNLLIGTLAGRLHHLLTQWPQTGLQPWLSDYEKLLLWQGQAVTVSGGPLAEPLTGEVAGIDSGGALMLWRAGGEMRHLQAGEISLRPDSP